MGPIPIVLLSLTGIVGLAVARVGLDDGLPDTAGLPVISARVSTNGAPAGNPNQHAARGQLALATLCLSIRRPNPSGQPPARMACVPFIRYCRDACAEPPAKGRRHGTLQGTARGG